MKISDVVKNRLEQIASAHSGRITADMVVADAKSKDSPLHGMFEWDARKAAQQHWLDTARKLIRSVEVVMVVENITVRAPVYVRDPDQETAKQGYIAVSNLRRDHDAFGSNRDGDK